MGRPNRERSDAVRFLLGEKGLAVNEAARRLGVPPSTVSYYARKLGIPPKPACRYDWSAVQRYYDAGHSIAQCREHFGMASRTITDAARKGKLKTRPQATPMPALLTRGRRRNRTHVKLRLLRHGIKDSECERCGIRDWRGLPLSMQLHHVNGVADDNRLDNLQLLCPNCHSQTENHSRKRTARR